MGSTHYSFHNWQRSLRNELHLRGHCRRLDPSHRGLAKSKSPLVGALIDDTPLVIIRAGQPQQEVIAGMKLRPEDLGAGARSAGFRSIEEVDYAILERNGRISIIPKEDSKPLILPLAAAAPTRSFRCVC